MGTTEAKPMTEIKKGDTVYVRTNDPESVHFGIPYRVKAVRARRGAWRNGEPQYLLDGYAYGMQDRDDVVADADVTPELRAAFDDAIAKRVREKANTARREERIKAKRKAFKLANPIPSEPVRSGEVTVERSDDRIVVSVPFTTYRYNEDRWSSRIEVETSAWGTVSVDIRRHYRTNALEFSTSGTSDKTAAQLAALGECITKALEVAEQVPMHTDTRIWGRDE